MPERRDHVAGAEPDRTRLSGKIGELDERIGRDCEIHAVVFANPGRLEPGRLGDQDKLLELQKQVAMRRV